jgi:putative phosphoesterase
VLAVLGDTHGTDGTRLEGRAAAAVDEADRVLHTGDFTTPAVHAAFERRARALVAVHGNNDDPALGERLPAVATVDALGRRFVLAHGHEHDRTGLSMLARQEEADCVIVGHSHRPGIEELGEATLVNPGSHADPRGLPPTHVEIDVVAGTVRLAVLTAADEERAAEPL